MTASARRARLARATVLQYGASAAGGGPHRPTVKNSLGWVGTINHFDGVDLFWCDLGRAPRGNVVANPWFEALRRDAACS